MRNIILGLGLFAVTALPTLAAAESKRGNPDLKKYCTGDALSVCAGLEPDDPKMDACFTKNRDKLSENCRRAIDAYEAGGGK